MELRDVGSNWHRFGKRNPFLSILTIKGKKQRGWNVAEFFKTGERDVAASLDRLEKLGVRLDGGRALDFGCGVGRLTQALATRFKKVDGVDIAPSMVRLAQSLNRHGNRCQYHINRTPDLRRFADQTFDLVYSKITLQHMEQHYAKAYLAEFIRVLKTTGVLVFQLTGEPQTECIVSHTNAIKRLLPKFFLIFLLRLKHAIHPVLEMHGIPRNDVASFIKQHGGHIIDIQKNNDAGEKWTSYEYVVTKI